ncbi:MAG: hypothetical protein B7X02_00620 [Rhodospirillales bacterium 12-54-5]|nr:MAG: hypothetical protein B7X02_00620 [Rhodospirillales bacterium 12-54-5]
MQSRNNSPTMDYITRMFVREPAWLNPVRERGEMLRAGMQVSPAEGKMLHWLLRISGAENILEIGSFIGYSTLWMAHALPPSGHITTLERDEKNAEIAAQHFFTSPHAAQINIVQGDALAWLSAQPLKPAYDFVFIDAEKRSYARYLESVMPLLKPRAWIVGDNSLLFGALSGEAPNAASSEAIAAIQQFNTLLADETRFESMLLPTTEGMTVARLR